MAFGLLKVLIMNLTSWSQKNKRSPRYDKMWEFIEQSKDILWWWRASRGRNWTCAHLRLCFPYGGPPPSNLSLSANCNLTQIGGLIDSKSYGVGTQWVRHIYQFYLNNVSVHICLTTELNLKLHYSFMFKALIWINWIHSSQKMYLILLNW